MQYHLLPPPPPPPPTNPSNNSSRRRTHISNSRRKSCICLLTSLGSGDTPSYIAILPSTSANLCINTSAAFPACSTSMSRGSGILEEEFRSRSSYSAILALRSLVWRRVSDVRLGRFGSGVKDAEVMVRRSDCRWKIWDCRDVWREVVWESCCVREKRDVVRLRRWVASDVGDVEGEVRDMDAVAWVRRSEVPGFEREDWRLLRMVVLMLFVSCFYISLAIPFHPHHSHLFENLPFCSPPLPVPAMPSPLLHKLHSILHRPFH